MLQRVLCPVLVGREEPLFLLEDALLASHSGDSRFVLLGGEAGMGKTRLATELARRAQRLGWAVLWGGCSEAELSLPYLPFVEAAANYLDARGIEAVAAEVGPAARSELSQLFPQLGGEAPRAAGDPAQAKLRLFEAVVSLLSVPGREQGVLLVLEDVHWADAATRELLEHLARRVTSLRSLVLATYRTDELDRRHPLTALVQGWRRSGIAETVVLEPLSAEQIGGMIEAIIEEEVGPAFRDLMYRRTDGNPFVLEEMLKEAVDRDDWSRRTTDELQVPETVREAILLRVDRLEPAHVAVLEAGAVLGRAFPYDTLVEVVECDADTVHDALAAATGQQLLVERGGDVAVYEWRHALTQEAIADAIVLPRRQQIHSRAADVLHAAGASAPELARHLLASARFEEAVPVCIAAAEEAEASLAFREAITLIEVILPHAREAGLRTRLLCRLGRALWLSSQAQAADDVLTEGIAALEVEDDMREAARSRLIRGRCRWELSRPGDALADFEHARDTLEVDGPSADLALAYLRIAGLHKFEFDEAAAIEAAERAIATATAAGADFERIWASSWLALSFYDTGRVDQGEALLDDAFREARERGYFFIAANIAYNDTWTRLHMFGRDVTARLDQVAGEAVAGAVSDLDLLMRAGALRAAGDLRQALELVDRSRAAYEQAGMRKFHWRTLVETAEILLELGRVADAAAVLPPLSERTELQDIVYDAAPQIRIRLARGDVEEAVALAREIAAAADKLSYYSETIALAVEAFVAGGLLDEAEALVAEVRGRPPAAGDVLVDGAEGHIQLVRGEYEPAAAALSRLTDAAAERNFRLVELRARILAAEALVGCGRREQAEKALGDVVAAAHAAGASLIRADAERTAERMGVTVAAPEVEAGASPELVAAGEQLVTSLFADVRGYTGIAATMPPAELVDRLGALHRWAAAEVGRHHGIVDKFAGDAVMATFNVTGSRLDHAQHAVEAALALSGKASLLDLGIGVGIAVGPAVVGRVSAGANVSVLGPATNLAARLQEAAERGEVVLSDEAYRRVAEWLSARGLTATREELELKGFDGAQPAWRIAAA